MFLKKIKNFSKLIFQPKALRKRLFPTRQEKIRAEWRKYNKKNVDRRIDYNLNSSSVVVEIGSYDGLWAKKIIEKFGCKVIIFEPVIEYCKVIEKNLLNHTNKFQVYPFGLGNKDTEMTFFLQDQGTSFIKRNSDAKEITVQLKDIVKFFNKMKISIIDLVKINIEGGEYDLLEHIINFKLVEKFENILVQFHRRDGIEDRLKNIRKNLQNTHQLSWQYEYVFESWKLK